MEQLINWDFVPKNLTRRGVNPFHASVYWNPNKKSPTYTMQLHVNAPKKLLNAEHVTFGKLNDSIVITDTNKGNAYKVHGKRGTGDAQINGKGLCKKIVEHFNLDTSENHKVRLVFEPIGNKELRLWEVSILTD